MQRGPTPLPTASTAPPQRAAPPQAPRLPEAAQAADRAREANRKEREAVERHSVWRGLLLLALLALLISFWRAGFGRVFAPNWWRQW